MPAEDLVERLKPIAERAKRAKGKMGEENTKNKIVVPVLEAIGWTHDLMDFEHRVGGKKVDVALCDESGTPLVFVEVKGLNEEMKPKQQDVDQALGYAFGQGKVRWAVLTNGLHWWVYDCYARVPNERRRFIQVEITDVEQAAQELSVLSPDGVRKRKLAALAGRRLVWQELAVLLEGGDGELVRKVRLELGTVDDELVRDVMREAAATLRARLPALIEPPPEEGLFKGPVRIVGGDVVVSRWQPLKKAWAQERVPGAVVRIVLECVARLGQGGQAFELRELAECAKRRGAPHGWEHGRALMGAMWLLGLVEIVAASLGHTWKFRLSPDAPRDADGLWSRLQAGAKG